MISWYVPGIVTFISSCCTALYLARKLNAREKKLDQRNENREKKLDQRSEKLESYAHALDDWQRDLKITTGNIKVFIKHAENYRNDHPATQIMFETIVKRHGELWRSIDESGDS